ncbi:ATP-binding protein [Pseudorhodoferax soli]|uniref:histidine kinase n=1 Tax=Pseudorhodoferax soli TaxID=545864 RepID=A0A368Y815_9BURK|nr:ATP-binding protein [Pseudorhodoferax soli]RCW75476.1 PAS domain S-box-containing protein [Pseudorhodoferax soli]
MSSRTSRPWRRPVLRLRSHLAALLVAATLLSFALVAVALLAYRIPGIEAESRLVQAHAVEAMRKRLESLLQRHRGRLALLEQVIDAAPQADANAVLDSGVGTGGDSGGDSDALRALYRVSAQGRITAVGLPAPLRAQREDLLGNDMSGNPLLRAFDGPVDAAWSVLYPSLLNGEPSAAVARRDAHGDVLVAELPLAALLDAIRVVAEARSSTIWVVDRAGVLVADSRGGADIGRLNIHDLPLMQALLQGQVPAERMRMEGSWFHATVSYSPALGWFFIGRVPSGWANPEVRDTVLSAVVGAAGALAVALLVAPLWARRIARPLGRIIARADRSASGENAALPWPRGSVAEFNRLADELGSLTAAVHARERKSQAIFHASPVPMAVADVADGYRLVDVNHAWCEEFRFRREDVLGRSSLELGLWVDASDPVALRRHAERGESIGEVWLRRSDGTTMQVHLHAKRAQLPGGLRTIWACVDVGPLRRGEQELRELNQQLEERVQRRTADLAQANAELSQPVQQLRVAQGELVRADKMAALGGLVAGVAHEIKTPLGNGMVAVDAMADAVRGFQAAMPAGVRRGDLQQLVDRLAQGTDLAERNMRRASELVQSFKQVAVDQTSAQRRSFEIGEVVREMVVTLRPSFAGQPWRIETDVAASGLQLDSYPGALGQVLGNLIQNAVLHGFAGRAHGTVRITAGRGEDGRIWLRVADDGHGIAAAHIGRIFDPFMTTRMGSGGTGLGLHISQNAVTSLLGGTLTVTSTEGEGTCFELRLPVQAPEHVPAGEEV